MEFPTAMLGVALGVVLMPQLAGARAAKDDARYSAMLDWGLRLVVLLAVPCAVALLVFAKPLVAVLFHYGAFNGLRRAAHQRWRSMGYGVGPGRPGGDQGAGAGLLRAARTCARRC